MKQQTSATRLRYALHRRRSPFWFLSFPKCGRTWTKNVVENYVARIYGLPPFTFEEFAPWVRTGTWRQVPRVCFHHPQERGSGAGAVHRLLSRLESKQVAFLVRDPRDVVVTYYFRLRKRKKDAEALQMDFSEFLAHEELGIGSIVQFMNQWHGYMDRFEKSLFLRFEDIQSAPEVQFESLIRFLGLPWHPETLADVLRGFEDHTTTGIEDGSVQLSEEDRALMESKMKALDPALGYQVGL